MPPHESTSAGSRQSWLPAFFVLMACVVFGYAVLPHFAKQVAPSSKLLGQPAPDFSLPILHGGDETSRIRLSALLGNVVVLDFWASWCKPCAAQARILSAVAPRHALAKVVFIGVNTADNPARARDFARAHALPYPSVLDTGEAAEAYGASSLPTLVVIDKSGKVTSLASRIMSSEEIEAAIVQASNFPGAPAGF